MREELWDVLESGFLELGIQWGEESRACFSRFLVMYMDAVGRFSLSSIRNERDVLVRHFLDSVCVLPVLKEYNLWRKELKYLDLGSGAGFPGIPLKLIEKNFTIDLAEVNKKKHLFSKNL